MKLLVSGSKLNIDGPQNATISLTRPAAVMMGISGVTQDETVSRILLTIVFTVIFSFTVTGSASFKGAAAVPDTSTKALNYGGMKSIVLTNKQCIFERNCGDQRVLVAINMDSQPFTAHFDAGCGQAKELISGKIHDFGGGSTLAPKSSEIWLMER